MIFGSMMGVIFWEYDGSDFFGSMMGVIFFGSMMGVIWKCGNGMQWDEMGGNVMGRGGVIQGA